MKNQSLEVAWFSAIAYVPLVAILMLSSIVTADDQKPIDSPVNVIRVASAVVRIADTVTVPAEYAGILTSVDVKEGQILKTGDLIGRINSAELRLRLKRAEYDNQIAKLEAENDVDIRYAQKSGEVAQAELDRSHQSNSRVKNSVSIAKIEKQELERDRTVLQLEQAKRDFDAARLKMNLTENDVELANLLLKKTEIRSPMDGMVIAVARSRGEWVESSETVVKMVRVDRLRVEGFVSAENLRKINVGSLAEVQFKQTWLKKHKFKGRIVFISPEANPVNSQILIWAEIDNSERHLVPGLRGEILIHMAEALPKNASAVASDGR